jgi:hypothetical protein
MCFPIPNSSVYPPGMGDQETLLKGASLFNPQMLEPIRSGLTVPMADSQLSEAGIQSESLPLIRLSTDRFRSRICGWKPTK